VEASIVKLTVKQKAFADFYIKLGNATEAAIKAGYSEKTAYSIGNENLNKPEVKKYIEERMAQIESDRIAKAEEVLAFLSASLRGEVLEEVVSTETDETGGIRPVIIKKQISIKDRLKAAELLGKRYRMWTDKVEANIQQQIVFEGESDLEE
jgi:phage terminase small subunit